MIEVMEDEDDHVLEQYYTIDHVYQSMIIIKSKFALGNRMYTYLAPKRIL